MRTNYMMTVEDVMNELGVKRSKAYSILKQLNNELEKEGYVAVRGKTLRSASVNGLTPDDLEQSWKMWKPQALSGGR